MRNSKEGRRIGVNVCQSHIRVVRVPTYLRGGKFSYVGNDEAGSGMYRRFSYFSELSAVSTHVVPAAVNILVLHRGMARIDAGRVFQKVHVIVFRADNVVVSVGINEQWITTNIARAAKTAAQTLYACIVHAYVGVGNMNLGGFIGAA